MSWTRVALVALTISACRGRDAAESPADRQAVLAAAEQYRQAFLLGDTAMALGVISDSARYMIAGVPDIRGEGVRKLVVDEMAAYRIPTLTVNREELIVRGDHAIDIGTYDEMMVPKTGAPIHGAGRYMTIWRREGNEWRIIRFMLNEPK
jgi:ketosteroid isomerase-like protein